MKKGRNRIKGIAMSLSSNYMFLCSDIPKESTDTLQLLSELSKVIDTKSMYKNQMFIYRPAIIRN